MFQRQLRVGGHAAGAAVGDRDSHRLEIGGGHDSPLGEAQGVARRCLPFDLKFARPSRTDAGKADGYGDGREPGKRRQRLEDSLLPLDGQSRRLVETGGDANSEDSVITEAEWSKNHAARE